MKIHIIGASGAGKTYLAHKLAERYTIPVFSLDDLLWDNSAGHYNVKRDEKTRDDMLVNILQNKDWIIEGVQYSWCDSCFLDADTIYLLEIPAYFCRLRIIRRFIERKMHKKSRHKETLKSLVQLLKWTKRFYSINLVEIKEKLEEYDQKVVTVSSKKEIRRLIS